MTQDGSFAPSAHLGKAGIFLDLYAPALIIGQVPVKAVHAMQCHDVEVALHRLGVKEVAHTIKVHTAITKSWIGNNLCGRHIDRRGLADRQ